VVAEKYRLIIFGRYPFEQQWRPLVATVLMVALLVASCMRRFWRPWLLRCGRRCWRCSSR
jgi:general L-amino acid transport system permease protein